jgi:hypothetical protein
MNLTSPTFDWEPPIQELRRLTQDMLELAQAGEWEIVTEIEEQRRVLIEQLLREPPPAEWASRIRETVQATLSSNARVQELASAERDKLGEKLRGLRTGRRALSAYDDA